MNFKNRFSRKAIIVTVASSLFLAFAVPAVKAATDLRIYVGLLKDGMNSRELASSTSKVKRDLDAVLTISKAPLISQLLDIAGVNFSDIADELAAGIEIAPAILGSEKPLNYLVSFQNSAEARGTGGILGAYAILEFQKGHIRVIKTGSNASLYSISLKKIPVDVPNEFLSLYGQNPAILQNSNLSPHFPYGAEIWLGLWKAKFGEQLDGVIAIDPSALSYILRATGEIVLANGEKINSDNVVEETLKNAYKKYENDNHARKQYLVDILNSAVKKIQNGEYSKIELAKALRKSIIENRLLMYSTNSDVETSLSKTRLGGFMSIEPNNEFRTVIQNIDASKLDYYLNREVSIKSLSCKKDRETQVKIRVTNTLVSGRNLPAYVLTRADKGKPSELVTGAHRFKVFIYGPVDARLVSVSRENRTANLGGSAHERSRPIYVADVDLGPGESEELLANFSGGTGKISFIDQPLVRTTKISIADNC